MRASGRLAVLALVAVGCGETTSRAARGDGDGAARPSPCTRPCRCRVPSGRRRPTWSRGSSWRSSRPAARPVTSRSSTSRSTTRPRRPARGRPRRRRRTPARRRRTTHRGLHRRVQLGRLGGLDPDPERDRRPADQPRQHGRRPDLGRAGAGPGEPEQVLPQRSAHLHADRPQGHDPGRGARHRHEGGRLHQGLHDQRQGGLRRRPRQNIQNSAKAQGLEIIANEAVDKNPPNYRSLAAAAAGAGADCFVFSGITANNAVQLYKDFAAALRTRSSMGPTAWPRPASSTRRRAASRRTWPAKVTLTVATLSPDQYPPEGQEFFDAFREKYDEPNPNPYAIYGYEAMRLALDAIERSGTGEKADVLAALFETRTARACSAPTRSTRTGTPRSPTTASTRSRAANSVRPTIRRGRLIGGRSSGATSGGIARPR